MMKERERKGKKKEIFKMWLPTVYLEDPSYFPEEKKKEKKKRKINKKVQPDLAFITQTCMLKAFLFSFLFLVLYCPSREIWVTIPG